MEWLKSIAPMLGTAIAGPLGGVAATFIADKLGMSEKTVEAVKEAISTGQMTPADIASIKLAEIEFQKFLKQNGIDLEKIHAADRADARSMFASTRSRIPAILSILITVGYFGILIGMMMGWLKVSDSQALLIMLGSLNTAWGMVIAFWFGTTSNSNIKTEMIAASPAMRR